MGSQEQDLADEIAQLSLWLKVSQYQSPRPSRFWGWCFWAAGSTGSQGTLSIVLPSVFSAWPARGFLPQERLAVFVETYPSSAVSRPREQALGKVRLGGPCGYPLLHSTPLSSKWLLRRGRVLGWVCPCPLAQYIRAVANSPNTSLFRRAFLQTQKVRFTLKLQGQHQCHSA